MFGKSIFAGIFIAIGSLIYVKIGGPVGAVMFSVGLLGILLLELKLYTGVIGFVDSKQGLIDSIKVLLGNIIGTMILLPYINPNVNEIITNKLSNNLGITFLNACICGALIYCAVCAFRKNNSLIVIMSVAGFILFGAEHSIADICFLMLGNYISLKAIIFIITVIIGNGCGAHALHQIVRK